VIHKDGEPIGNGGLDITVALRGTAGREDVAVENCPHPLQEAKMDAPRPRSRFLRAPRQTLDQVRRVDHTLWLFTRLGNLDYRFASDLGGFDELTGSRHRKDRSPGGARSKYLRRTPTEHHTRIAGRQHTLESTD
jgi:hypothetical protein